jgi:2-oxoacid:acceptor oxidoreductase delta subunit (pyruvate/2-ketoisovalerate family)
MEWKPVKPVRQNSRVVADSEKMVYDYFDKAPQVKEKIRPADVRKCSFEGYSTAFSEDEALHEAARCMHCGRCTECDNCLIFCPDVSILIIGNGHFGYSIDYDYCKGCGICFTECPRCAMSMVDTEIPIEGEG